METDYKRWCFIVKYRSKVSYIVLKTMVGGEKMTLGMLEKLLTYINLYHNPEQSVTLRESASDYQRKMVADIDCKMVLHKNWLPAGRVSTITIRLNTGEEKTFDVSNVDWRNNKRLLEIKWWLIGAEPGDWYGLTCIDNSRWGKFFWQVVAFREMHPGFDVNGVTSTKDFLNSLSSDPFYMCDDEMYRQLEKLVEV